VFIENQYQQGHPQGRDLGIDPPAPEKISLLIYKIVVL
jgi:hypothetical protein